MGKHLTARNIAEEFGESSRHWTKMAEAGQVPGTRRSTDKGGWLFDLDLFRAWHEGGQKPVAAVPPPGRDDTPPPRRGGPTPQQKRVKAAIDDEASRLVKAALQGRRT